MRKWFLLGFIALILWFIPWVFSFYLGLVVYFPYEADGKSRYVRATGPMPAALGLDHEWASGDEIPLVCRACVVAAEDGRFFEHNGIDTDSIKQAIEQNNKRGKIKFGASTVTQQLVKNVFLYRNKTYIRKAREIVGAVMLDFIMNKDKQLIWYLNVVEFGPQVYGIRAAAKYYFRKDVKRLTLPECASLVAIVRDPNRSGKWLKAKAIPDYLARRRDGIIVRVSQWGLVQKLREEQSS
jgi:monofunctional biosynthetic peptidoglycan transglycosylase